ncbi:hypothetical protein M011DRAFT_482039 [Sporormia fimetaria CBS 119925]|uniref:Putative gamma-glutamylcyclotransferase n=1 Tax=Sporormia fimetaria CBS 119925 TaxID=1340428 RepID=A0A6A6UX33_9PLEO|nr:hypothetical protein M011DRAFT_482039 [Sporormia fimetaria CBS 119925]
MPASSLGTTHTAFFYGTLMAPAVLNRVVSRAIPPQTICSALLPQHQRHRVRDADYPAVLPSSSSSASVRGTVVTGLTDSDIWRLDIFEGDEYERRRVRVRVLAADDMGVEGEGEEVDAETYIWVAGEERLEKREWDFEGFVRDKMVRWVGGPDGERDSGFSAVDDAVAAVGDPTGGRGLNGAIAAALDGQTGSMSSLVHGDREDVAGDFTAVWRQSHIVR